MPNIFGRETLEEILATGVANQIAGFLRFGLSPDEIAQRIMATDFNITFRTAQAAVNRALQSFGAADLLGSLPFGQTLLIRSIPFNPLLESQIPGNAQPRFMYQIALGFNDPLAGRVNYTTIYVESNQNLAKNEIYSDVRRQFQAIQQGLQGTDRIRGRPLGSIASIGIEQVWRTS